MSSYMWGEDKTQFFYHLDQDQVLNTIEEHGLVPTGRCYILNSMENRVYEIEVEDNLDRDKTVSIVAKFYRPGRWSKEQITDEHNFVLELKDSDIPVIAPIVKDKQSVFYSTELKLYYSLFPKKGGRAPDELQVSQLEVLGRTLARLHNVGAGNNSKHRIRLTPDTYGLSNLDYLLKNNHLPAHIELKYASLVEDIVKLSAPHFENIDTHRIHGDCHLGNIISRDQEGLFFIDFDDMVVGPAIQDIWLLIPGRDQHSNSQRNILLEAYQSMRDFDRGSLSLTEPLRALRYIHFTAWIAKRWNDPAFKLAFPQFGEHQYFDIQIADLEYQKVLIKNYSPPTHLF